MLYNVIGFFGRNIEYLVVIFDEVCIEKVMFGKLGYWEINMVFFRKFCYFELWCYFIL